MACRSMWQQQTWTPLWPEFQILAQDLWCAYAPSSVCYTTKYAEPRGKLAIHSMSVCAFVLSMWADVKVRD